MTEILWETTSRYYVIRLYQDLQSCRCNKRQAAAGCVWRSSKRSVKRTMEIEMKLLQLP